MPGEAGSWFSNVKLGAQPEASLRMLLTFAEFFHRTGFTVVGTFSICSSPPVSGQRWSGQVRYGVKRGFFVQGLLEVEVRDLSDILAVVNEGNGNRKVSSHLLNKDSSRSHSLLSVCLHGQFKDADDGHVVRTFGKVVLFCIIHTSDNMLRNTYRLDNMY